MAQWWEIAPAAVSAALRAVAYYRHSAQDWQENSVPIISPEHFQRAQELQTERLRENTCGARCWRRNSSRLIRAAAARPGIQKVRGRQ